MKDELKVSMKQMGEKTPVSRHEIAFYSRVGFPWFLIPEPRHPMDAWHSTEPAEQ